MQRAGLAALAETYGLEPLELYQLQLLGKRFFDQLLAELISRTTRPIKVFEVTQNLKSFGQFSNSPDTEYLFVLGYDNEAALAFRVERGMARAMVDALVGVSPSNDAAVPKYSESSLTATESRVFVRILGRSITSTLDRVFSHLFGDRGSAEILLSADHPAFGPKSFDASEQLVTAQARCTINQVSGCFTLGLPMSVVYQIRAKLIPPLIARTNRSPEGTKNVAALTAVPIEMQALLGRRTMLFSQVRKLKVGSVVLLQKLERELPKVEMRTAGQLLFRGTIVDDHGWHNFLIQQIGDRDGQ